MPELGTTEKPITASIEKLEKATEAFTASFCPVTGYMRSTWLEVQLDEQNWAALWQLEQPFGNPYNRIILATTSDRVKGYSIYQGYGGLIWINNHPSITDGTIEFSEDWTLPEGDTEVEALRDKLATVLESFVTQQG
jgi:hypothetical protein